MQVFDRELAKRWRIAFFRWQSMPKLEKLNGTLGAAAGISADAKARWGKATEAAKLDERTRLADALTRLDAEIQEQAELKALPKATNRAILQKMRERLESWPDDQPAPNEEDDFAAISAFFAPGSLSRDEFRLVRTDDSVVPPEWRKQGPRRPWKKVKPKSAA